MEKTSWSLKIEYNGISIAIEHRKFALGIFDNPANETEAEEVASRIRKAVAKATHYFEFIAAAAAQRSELNVDNRSRDLFARYEYFLDQYRQLLVKIEENKDKTIVTKTAFSTMTSFPVFQFYREASWNAIAVIDAFFSWTEHVFSPIAILKRVVGTGVEVADLAKTEWAVKFKKVVFLDQPAMKASYDELTEMRRQVRNFLDHGSFGKNEEAFQFHSGAGAVPLLLPHQRGKLRLLFRADWNLRIRMR